MSDASLGETNTGISSSVTNPASTVGTKDSATQDTERSDQSTSEIVVTRIPALALCRTRVGSRCMMKDLTAVDDSMSRDAKLFYSSYLEFRSKRDYTGIETHEGLKEVFYEELRCLSAFAANYPKQITIYNRPWTSTDDKLAASSYYSTLPGKDDIELATMEGPLEKTLSPKNIHWRDVGGILGDFDAFIAYLRPPKVSLSSTGVSDHVTGTKCSCPGSQET